MPVTSSEKSDHSNRYKDFCLFGTPYPGVDFFKKWKEKKYSYQILYDWDGILFILFYFIFLFFIFYFFILFYFLFYFIFYFIFLIFYLLFFYYFYFYKTFN